MIDRRSTSKALLGLSGAVVLATSAPAAAEVETIRIDYRSARGCPTAEQFVNRVLRRTQNARLAQLEEDARTFVVVIERSARGYSGSLAVRENGGSTVARTVTARRCGDVAGVLALSTSLAVDPTAPTPSESSESSWEVPGPADTPNAPQRSEAEAAAGEAPPSSAAPASAVGNGGENAPPKETQPDSVSRERSVEGEDGPAAPWSGWLSVGPSLRTGASPRAAFGASVALEARRDAPSFPLSAAALELTFLRSLSARVGGASAVFEFASVRPRVCAWSLHIVSALSLSPCLAGELGFLAASGSNLPEPRTQRRFWAAAELAARLDLSFSQRLSLHLDSALVVHGTRYRFVFEDPETAIYKAPAAGFATGLRLAAEL